MADEEPQMASSPLHGGQAPRGLGAGVASGHGRFGRMFEGLAPCVPSDEAIEALVAAIGGSGATLGNNRRIPAGFTYLGQFIDHDITFDPNSQLDRLNDPLALTNFRSPRLDLDSVYGSGPADQPYLYDWSQAEPDPGVKLLVAQVPAGEGRTIDDLPRNEQERALIGDPRNDVHLIIAQLHLLFLRFHNKVVDTVRRDRELRGAELFLEACRIVRWHYGWIVAHDFLPRVVGKTTAERVLKPAGSWPPVERRHLRWERAPFIPVEFSGAAFRFGHSMVRDSYSVQRPPAGVDGFPPVVAPDPKIVPKTDTGSPASHLTGFRRLIAELEIDWGCFFELDAEQPPQPSMCIDRGLAIRMSSMPAAIAGERSLPRLNLQRGRALGLPSGQDVARAVGQPAPLTFDELFPEGALGAVAEPLRRALERSTPLWYYVLAEAAGPLGEEGRHLGPVGGTIVAEVLAGILEGDPQSHLSQAPAWTPELRLEGTPAGTFTMADLVRFTNAPDPPAAVAPG